MAWAAPDSRLRDHLWMMFDSDSVSFQICERGRDMRNINANVVDSACEPASRWGCIA